MNRARLPVRNRYDNDMEAVEIFSISSMNRIWVQTFHACPLLKAHIHCRFNPDSLLA